MVQLAAGRPKDAHSYFTTVISELPGELAPRLALAVSYEMAALAHPSNGTMSSLDAVDDLRRAAHQFEIVAATDPGFASASFGLSRVRTALGDRVGAVAALERIPSSSSSHAAAQIALCGVLCADISGQHPAMSDLVTASHLLDRLRAEPSVRLALTRDLHVQTLALLADPVAMADPGARADASLGGASLAGAPLTESNVRTAIETTYRSLAKLAHTDEERFELVDLANAYRPRTLT